MNLNTHALYRGENYKVIGSKLVTKNEEIGVEFIDIILCIIRHIIGILNNTDNMPTTKTQ